MKGGARRYRVLHQGSGPSRDRSEPTLCPRRGRAECNGTSLCRWLTEGHPPFFPPSATCADDATPMGSRNGHAVLAIWNGRMRLDIAGFRNNLRACIERAEGFAAALRSVGVLVLLNPWSLTVVFPKQSGRLVNEYQHACNGGSAHAIVSQASKQISSMIMAFLGGSFLIAGDGLTTGSIVASASLLSPA